MREIKFRIWNSRTRSILKASGIDLERDDNIAREVPHQVVGFTSTDLLYYILATALGMAGLIALAIALDIAQKGAH